MKYVIQGQEPEKTASVVLRPGAIAGTVEVHVGRFGIVLISEDGLSLFGNVSSEATGLPVDMVGRVLVVQK